LLLSASISESHRKLFYLKDKIVNQQSKIFLFLTPEQFEKIELDISEKVKQQDLMHNATHEKKWTRLMQNKTSVIDKRERNAVWNDKLVVNLSDTQLTKSQQDVLARGLKFAVVPNKILEFDFIKAVLNSV
jgi:hypothetical protein